MKSVRRQQDALMLGFNPDQPRASDGKFGSGGGGKPSAHHTAIAKALAGAFDPGHPKFDVAMSASKKLRSGDGFKSMTDPELEAVNEAVAKALEGG